MSDTVVVVDGIEILTCTCCGQGVPDTAEHNVSHGERPYPHDKGFGLCRECGGRPEAKSVRKRLGWAATAFYDTRIAILKKKLSPANSARFAEMSYERQIVIVTKMIEKGLLV